MCLTGAAIEYINTRMDTPAQFDLFTGEAVAIEPRLEFPELPDCFFEDDKREVETVGDPRSWQDIQADEACVPRFGPI